MQQSGALAEWNDARGFGFIDRTGGGRCFVHISAIEGPMRPRLGDELLFRVGAGRDGRPQALDVRLAKATVPSRRPHVPPRATASVGLGWRSVLAGVLAVLLGAGLLGGTVPLPLGGLYLGAGLLALALYHHDKQAAQAGQWRISEASLHALDLGCGIIGGLLAQERFRHKTRKPAFVALTLVIAAIHLFWLAGLALGLITPAELAALLPGFV